MMLKMKRIKHSFSFCSWAVPDFEKTKQQSLCQIA